MAYVNNQYFEFHEIEALNKTKMVLINWLIDRADLALSVHF